MVYSNTSTSTSTLSSRANDYETNSDSRENEDVILRRRTSVLLLTREQYCEYQRKQREHGNCHKSNGEDGIILPTHSSGYEVQPPFNHTTAYTSYQVKENNADDEGSPTVITPSVTTDTVSTSNSAPVLYYDQEKASNEQQLQRCDLLNPSGRGLSSKEDSQAKGVTNSFDQIWKESQYDQLQDNSPLSISNASSTLSKKRKGESNYHIAKNQNPKTGSGRIANVPQTKGYFKSLGTKVNSSKGFKHHKHYEYILRTSEGSNGNTLSNKVSEELSAKTSLWNIGEEQQENKADFQYRGYAVNHSNLLDTELKANGEGLSLYNLPTQKQPSNVREDLSPLPLSTREESFPARQLSPFSTSVSYFEETYPKIQRPVGFNSSINITQKYLQLRNLMHQKSLMMDELSIRQDIALLQQYKNLILEDCRRLGIPQVFLTNPTYPDTSSRNLMNQSDMLICYPTATHNSIHNNYEIEQHNQTINHGKHQLVDLVNTKKNNIEQQGYMKTPKFMASKKITKKKVNANTQHPKKVKQNKKRSDEELAQIHDKIRQRKFRCLGTDNDKTRLTAFFCFLRKECIESFRAQPLDVCIRRRSKKVLLGQVGIRCRFCVDTSPHDRAGRSSSFPSSLDRIYQSVIMMVREHFSICDDILPEIREEYEKLKSDMSRKRKVIESKSFWVEAAMNIRMINSGEGIKLIENKFQDEI